MTEDYKKNLMDLFCGRAIDNDFSGVNEENQLSSSEYGYSSILPANASNIGIYGVLEVPETLGNKSVLYGEYQLNSEWYGLIILIDENQNPEECITEFDSGTKLRPIQKMIMDNSGSIYAVDSTMPGFLNYNNVNSSDYSSAVLRFIMLNNFTLKSNGSYELRLRSSYIITSQVSITGRDWFCRDIFKDPGSANYILVGTNTLQNRNPQVIHLTINVGSANEWVLYTKNYNNTITVFEACNVSWSNGEPEFIGFVIESTREQLIKFTFNDSQSFNEEVLFTTPGFILQTMLRSFLSYKFFSNNLGYFTVIYAIQSGDDIVQSNECFKYENGSIEILYEDINTMPEVTIDEQTSYRYTNQLLVVGDINNFKFLRLEFGDNTYTTVNVYKSESIGEEWQQGTYPSGRTWQGYFQFENEPFTSYGLPVQATPTTYYEARKILWSIGVKKTNFNLNYYYLFPAYLPSVSDGKYTIVKNLFVANGYSGSYPTYDIEDTYINSLVPKQVISSHIQGEETIVDFARNIYNIQIDGNITTSSVEIPYNYLNENNNRLALFSETNLQMNNDHSMVKNRYEIVDANFVNAISIINNNDNAGIYNQVGASRLNSAVTNGADYTYYIDKFLINYSDGTYKLNTLEVVKDDDTHSHIVFSFFANKEINNIELVDNSTSIIEGVLQKGIVYQTIDGSNLQVGKLYAINQPVHIE